MLIHANALILPFMRFCLLQVFDGKIPEDRLVLRELTKEMLNWPNLEVRSIIIYSLRLLYEKGAQKGRNRFFLFVCAL